MTTNKPTLDPHNDALAASKLVWRALVWIVKAILAIAAIYLFNVGFGGFYN